MNRLTRSGAPVAPLALLVCMLLFSHRAEGQIIRAGTGMPNGPDDRSGPRLGVAWLTSGSVTAEQEGRNVAPVMTLFGWQFEHQFEPPPTTDMPLPIVETIFLIGGLEQNVMLPSATMIVGLRRPNGWEGGLGALVTPSGSSLIGATGITTVVGNYNVPLNLAISPGRRGMSISLTTGINERRFRRR